jgi:putative intracellular protease/amidase
MSESKAHVLLVDGYSDWEIGHVLPELRRSAELDVVSVGFADQPVTSMGGLQVCPQLTLSKVTPQDVLIFILPGSHIWEGSYPASELEGLLNSLEQLQRPIAAICGATLAIARAGLLQGRKHTSNSRDYLTKKVPDYREGDNYVDALAVRDRRLISASGLGCIEFALEIFNELDLFTSESRRSWYEAFKYGQWSPAT